MDFDYYNTKRFVYVTNHSLNQQVSKSLVVGFSAQAVYPQRLYNKQTKQLIDTFPLYKGLSICYGILRGTGNVMKECSAERMPYLYVDHSFFGALRTGNAAQGYYRTIKSDRYTHDTPDYPADRFNELKLSIKPWRTNGDHIVVTPLSKYVAGYSKMHAEGWLQATMEDLAKHTDRPIVVKPKDSDIPLSEVLKNAWALVTLDSNSAVDAAVAGVPVFTSPSAAAAPVANFSYLDIENPRMPDREQWLNNLAYKQFTLAEIENGTAARLLYKEAL